MKAFMDENFLLSTPCAQHLYHDYAEHMPIYDYHCHLSPKEIAVVELFAGYTTSRDDHCYDIAISDSDDMLAFVNAATAKSDFASGAEVLPGDRLVTLSTCAYVFENARYIAIGRLVTAWTEEEM